MDFARSSKADELVSQLTAFLVERVIPAEAEAVAERQSALTEQSPTVERLKVEAKERGLWNLCVRDKRYGPGLSFVDFAPLAQMMGPIPSHKKPPTATPLEHQR